MKNSAVVVFKWMRKLNYSFERFILESMTLPLKIQILNKRLFILITTQIEYINLMIPGSLDS